MQEMMIKGDISLSPIMKDVYRRLRTNIEFTGVENRVICITSCVAGDGKSSVSYHLAKSFAEDDKKVLLIDADMRNSILHRRAGFKKDIKGLSHFLSGKEHMPDVIYTTNYKNLFLLPTGMLPKNPTELLNKARFSNLITASKKAFDYVFIDTPPLGMVIDAAIIAKECDGSVLVISSDKVSRKMAITVKSQLQQANKNLLGVVLNRFDNSNSVYGKKYGYGYGNYGANQKEKSKEIP